MERRGFQRHGQALGFGKPVAGHTAAVLGVVGERQFNRGGTEGAAVGGGGVGLGGGGD